MTAPTGKGFSDYIGRWSGLGPYYAMFPTEFAFDVVRMYSSAGDIVLDPFAGRGTSVFAAAAQGRTGIGIEINPVGWLFGQAKVKPATRGRVLCRLGQIASSNLEVSDDRSALPPFFRSCFHRDVLDFLLRSRLELNWRTSRTDATLMALILVYLHGKAGSALSNQMRQSKSMSPDYSVRWWKKRGLRPPALDPVEFLRPRIEWRYDKGCLSSSSSGVYLGNSITTLPRIGRAERLRGNCDLLFTSPPYLSITNYFYDQWLRLWMLGGDPSPQCGLGPHKGKFSSKEDYTALLTSVFQQSAPLLAPSAAIYVRTDAREFTLNATRGALKIAFPSRVFREEFRPMKGRSQTALFGDASNKPGEVDLVSV